MDLTAIPAPYMKIEEYEAFFNAMNIRYYDYNKARQMLTNYDANALLKLDTQAENEKFQARKAQTTALKRKEASNIIANDAAVLLLDLGALRADIVQNTFELENYGRGEQHISLGKALQQTRYYLEAIRQQADAFQHIRTASNCAWHYFYYFNNASDVAFDRQVDVEMLWRDMNQTNFKITDMQLNIDRILETQNEIEDIQEHIINRQSYLREDCAEIAEVKGIIEKHLNHSLIPETENKLEINFEQQHQLVGELQNISRLSSTLNATLYERGNLRREVRKHWLPKAQKHAQRLMERSNEYARQFQPTRNGARIALLAR